MKLSKKEEKKIRKELAEKWEALTEEEKKILHGKMKEDYEQWQKEQRGNENGEINKAG